jgi:hypothetical protein
MTDLLVIGQSRRHAKQGRRGQDGRGDGDGAGGA